MHLNEETAELILECYDSGKAYIKDTEHSDFAEELIRLMINRGYEFGDIVDEMGDHDTAFGQAIDVLSPEFSDDTSDEEW